MWGNQPVNHKKINEEIKSFGFYLGNANCATEFGGKLNDHPNPRNSYQAQVPAGIWAPL